VIPPGRRGPRAAAVAFVTVVALVLGACSRDAPPPTPSGPTAGEGDVGGCALAVEFHGHMYDGVLLAVEPVPGRPLGTASLPACQDTNSGTPAPEEQIEVARLPGVDPDVAVVWVGQPDTVFVRRNVDELPAEIATLMDAPTCRPEDAPIQLAGPWLSILGADGKTEVDLKPPYDVGLLVQEASDRRYERAHLTVRVPPSLGTPISRRDVQTSLQAGGTISISASCEDEAFVADAGEAFPPA
jgi:hypothetical protein